MHDRSMVSADAGQMRNTHRGRVFWRAMRTARLAVTLAAAALGMPAAASATGLVTPRVVGGQPATSITQFPYQAALYIAQSGTSVGGLNIGGTDSFCGGVVIDPIQVLTAAHCVTDETSGQSVSPASVTVLTGTATLPPHPPSGPNAAAVAVDPSYDASTNDYDLAVLTMAQPLYGGSPRPDGTVSVAPVPLVTAALTPAFSNPELSPPTAVTVSGFGETTARPPGTPDTGTISSQLQYAVTHFVSNETCASDYSGIATLTPRMICAGESNGSKDACSGDSGGPLVTDVDDPANAPADDVLVGLVDFGAGCGQANFPGVYVRIANPAVSSFIQSQAEAHGQTLIGPPTPRNTSAAPSSAGSPPSAKAAPSSPVASLAHLRITSAHCTRTRCTVRLSSTAPVHLHAALVSGHTAVCPRAGCPHSLGVEIRTRGGERRFAITRAGLRRAHTYTLVLSAPGAQGTSVVLRTPRR